MITDDRMLDRCVLALDPARASRPEAAREPAAQAMLERILREPRDGSSGEVSAPPRQQRPVRRWVLAGTAAAAVAAGVVVLSPWGSAEPAFASWTPVPNELPAAVVDELAPQCATGQVGTSGARERDVVLAEERGRVRFVVLVSGAMIEHCLLVDGQFASAGSASHLGRPADPGPAAVDTILVAGGGHGLDAYTAVTGRVGSDVVAIDVHPGAQHTAQLPESVRATIAEGYYGAWWPGMSTDGDADLSLTLHLADGTTVEHVPAFDGRG